MDSKTLNILFGLSLLFFGFTEVVAQNTPATRSKPIEHEIGRLEDEWLNTYISGDRARYDQIVADDFTGIDESAVLRTKAEDRALLPASRVLGGIAVNEDIQVRLYDKFAIVTGRIVTKFVSEGREIAGFRTRFTDTWVQREGSWKVIARHYSRYPQERTVAAVNSMALSELTGKYEIAAGMNFEVSVSDGKLYGSVGVQPALQLLPESEFVFFTKVPAALYLFTRDKSGNIGQILFIQDGKVTAAKKVSK